MKQDKLLSLLGLAKRAGKVQSGAFLAERSVKAGSARLVIVASDASGNTKKKFTDKCNYRHVPVCISTEDMETIGALIGEGPRSVVSIDDAGFAKALLDMLQNDQDTSGHCDRG